jgi:hypothetical protein
LFCSSVPGSGEGKEIRRFGTCANYVVRRIRFAEQVVSGEVGLFPLCAGVIFPQLESSVVEVVGVPIACETSRRLCSM